MNDKYRVALVTAVVALFAVAMGAAAMSVAAQNSATASSESVSIATQGDQATSSIDITADEGVAAADTKVSVDTGVVNITAARAVDETGNSQTDINQVNDGTVWINYTDIQAAQSDFTVGEVDLQAQTGNQDSTTVSLETANYNNASNSEFDTVTTNEGTAETGAQPDFVLSNLNPADGEVVQGDTLTVTADVANNGDADGTQNIELSLSGVGTVASESVPLNVGESTNVEFTVDTSGVGTGDYTHTVSSNDDSVSGSLSVYAAGIPGDRDRNIFDQSGVGDVYIGGPGDRPTVFQGERDIRFVDPNTGDVVNDLFSTNEDDRLLNVPISTDQELGSYTTSGNSGDAGVVVDQPETEELDIINQRGADGVTEATQGRTLVVGANINFAQAEPPEIDVRDSEGVEVEGDFVVAGNPGGNLRGQTNIADLEAELGEQLPQPQVDEIQSQDFDRLWAVRFDRSDDYEITVQPDDDGDLIEVDSSSRTQVVNIVSDEDAELSLDQSSAYQSEEVDFEVTGGNDQETYYVGLSEDDHRFTDVFDDDTPALGYDATVGGAEDTSQITLDRVFRSTGDVNDRGFSTGADGDVWYWVELEISGTTATGRLDASLLDSTSVDLQMLEEDVSDVGGNRGFGVGEDLDEVTLDVEETEIGIDSPSQTYVPGTEVDLNGTVSNADTALDLGVFTRDRDEYFLVTTTNVETDDDQYEETDFDLSEDSASSDARDIVGQPGVYRYGVVDMIDVFVAEYDEDANTDVGDWTRGGPGLRSADFNSGASTQQSLRVAEPSLEADFHTYDEQIFTEDGVDLTGTLIGPRQYVTVMTDSRGNTQVDTDTADRDDGAIDQENIDTRNLRTGNIRAAVLSPGRDGVFGNGEFGISDSIAQAAGVSSTPDATIPNFVDIVNDGVTQVGFTQSQVTELLLAETVEDAASDDLLVSEEFRLRDDSSTQIQDVVPAQLSDNATGIVGIEVGEDMVVRGLTNRNPDEATIVVEAVSGPSLADLSTAVTDEWDQDGVWNVTIPVTEEVEPGTYTIQSDDGERISEANVTIAAEGTYEEGERAGNQIGELQNQIEELQNQVDNLESERDDLEQQVSELEDENSQLEADLEEAQSQSDTGGEEPEDNETDDGEGQPGFTAVAALISLIAVALLAIRRQEE